MDAAPAPRVRLTYLNIRGLAEPARLALWVGGVVFGDERVTYDDVTRMREAHLSPFGQVPLLHVDGVVYAQAGAILRWAGRETGLYPDDDPALQLRVDMVEECLGDVRKALVPVWYGSCLGRDPRTGKLPAEGALSAQQREDVTRVVNETYVPTYLAQLERLFETPPPPSTCQRAITEESADTPKRARIQEPHDTSKKSQDTPQRAKIQQTADTPQRAIIQESKDTRQRATTQNRITIRHVSPGDNTGFPCHAPAGDNTGTPAR